MPTVIQSDQIASSNLGPASQFGLQVPAYLEKTYSAAYSLRQVRQRYAGYCLRVRNNTNNAEADVAFMGYAVRTSSVVTVAVAGTSGYSIGQTMTLAAFASTNDVRVVKWYDQSGNGRDAVQATALNQPALMVAGAFITENGIPIVAFDGANDGLIAVYSRPAALSLIVSGVTPTAGSAPSMTEGYNAGGTSHSLVTNYGTNVPSRQIYNGLAIGDAVQDLGRRAVYAIRFNGASSLWLANGTSIATGDSGSRTSTDLRMGIGAAGVSFNAKIWELLELVSVAEDLSDISSRVMAYYGMP